MRTLRDPFSRARVAGAASTLLSALLTPLASAAPESRPALEYACPRAPLAAWTLAPGRLVLETGASFRQAHPEARGVPGGDVPPQYLQVGASALRLGLPHGLELQAAFDGWAHRTRRTTSYEGLTDLSFALKAALIHDSEGATISALAGTRLPTGSTEFRAERARPRLGVLSSTPLGKRTSLHLDVVAERRPDAWGGIIAEGPMAGSAATRPAAVLLERAQLAIELYPNASVGGHVGVYYRRDPHLPDAASFGLGLGGQWCSRSGVIGELAAGFGVLDPSDHGSPEWYVALGFGYSVGLR